MTDFLFDVTATDINDAVGKKGAFVLSAFKTVFIWSKFR